MRTALALAGVLGALTALGGRVAALGEYDGSDDVPWSQAPPGGLRPSQVPQFVMLSFDDNAYSGLEGSQGTGGMSWATRWLATQRNPPGSANPATFDGAPVRATFFFTTVYISRWYAESPTFVKRSWRVAVEAGHEAANHTEGHREGGAGWGVAEWRREIQLPVEWLTRPFDPGEPSFMPDPGKGVGVAARDVFGFRAPFLVYNDDTFKVLTALGYTYDSSIEEGWAVRFDGTNYNWPYTLGAGSPGHEHLVAIRTKTGPVGPHRGLWEIGVHPYITPPDDKLATYGLETSIRQRLKALMSWFNVRDGKITGFDYNLFVQARMTKAEALATLKHTLDLRLQGNRAPLVLGLHSDEYSSKYTAAPNTTVRERQEVLEEFVAYALAQPEVRLVRQIDVIAWMRRPVPLGARGAPPSSPGTPDGGGRGGTLGQDAAPGAGAEAGVPAVADAARREIGEPVRALSPDAGPDVAQAGGAAPAAAPPAPVVSCGCAIRGRRAAGPGGLVGLAGALAVVGLVSGVRAAGRRPRRPPPVRGASPPPR